MYEMLQDIVSRETFDKLDYYTRMIFKWNTSINLVSRKSDYDKFFMYQIVDCINLYLILQGKSYNRIFDIGSGAGLPGLVLSIMGLDRIMTVDKLLKRVQFQQYVIKELGLQGVVSKHVDCRHLTLKTKDFKSIIVSKAVGSVTYLIELTKNLVTIGSEYYLMKSKDQLRELDFIDQDLFDIKIYNNIFNDSHKVFNLTKIK